MTAKYLAILTNQGAERLANAAALGTKLNLTQMAVGDANGTLPTPDPAQTKLINQKRIAPLNLLTVDPANTSQIIAEQIIPENEGGFWIREIGLYDDDGILIAVANCPETYKPQLQEGSGRTQTIRMILIVSSTSSITLKIDPSVVLATRKYADDKAIELKLYVDDLMSKHLAAADPHSQYATKDSPTFTGKPKAPTPPVVANDTQVATAGFVQAVIAALVSGELANKQPLDKTLTDLSGKDVAAILEYLGLSPRGLQTFLSSGSFIVPDNVYTIYLSGCAAGGGGGGSASNGGAANNAGGGAGGGAGQSILKQAVAVTPGQVIPITIGAAGIGGIGGALGSNNGSNGTNGGNTIIGTLATLLGGGFGGGGFIPGGGTQTTGYPAGGEGNDGAAFGGGGNGGSSPFGGGGGVTRGISMPGGVAGLNGAGHGSGGSGAGITYSALASAGAKGGNGTPGYVLIEW
ncbi:TPA: phage tail protein [Escherichia coli]|nr:phage tail protein [Escherichia coli]